MIARHETWTERADVWAKLAAPLPGGVISWRQDGKPTLRDGRYIARFVCYIEANTVRERLDSVVPGEWNLTLELLPALSGDEDGDARCAFKARLQVQGVTREDVGTGRDYKQASTDAFKRAAVRFGIGHELYSYEQNWVEVDGDGKYARPLEDPALAYERRYGDPAHRKGSGRTVDSTPASDVDAVSCPKCGGRMWDNRLTKRNPKAPDYKCRSRSCDGVIWPSRAESDESGAEPAAATSATSDTETKSERKKGSTTSTDDIPF